jgi:hypothetical protein
MSYGEKDNNTMGIQMEDIAITISNKYFKNQSISFDYFKITSHPNEMIQNKINNNITKKCKEDIENGTFKSELFKELTNRRKLYSDQINWWNLDYMENNQSLCPEIYSVKVNVIQVFDNKLTFNIVFKYEAWIDGLNDNNFNPEYVKFYHIDLKTGDEFETNDAVKKEKQNEFYAMIAKWCKTKYDRLDSLNNQKEEIKRFKNPTLKEIDSFFLSNTMYKGIFRQINGVNFYLVNLNLDNFRRLYVPLSDLQTKYFLKSKGYFSKMIQSTTTSIWNLNSYGNKIINNSPFINYTNSTIYTTDPKIKKVFVFKDNVLQKEFIYNSNGLLISSRIYQISRPKNQRIYVTRSTNINELKQSSSVHFDRSVNEVKFRDTIIVDTSITETIYTWDILKKNLLKQYSFTKNDAEYKKTISFYSFDKQNNLTRIEFYTSNGISLTEIMYVNNKRIIVSVDYGSYYDTFSTLTEKYNSKMQVAEREVGNEVYKCFYNKEGEIISSNTKEKLITSALVYDSNGNLIGNGDDSHNYENNKLVNSYGVNYERFYKYNNYNQLISVESVNHEHGGLLHYFNTIEYEYW